MRQKCESHRPRYCLKTGWLRCTVCKILLDDNGEEYKPYTKKEKELAIEFGMFIYSENCCVSTDEIDVKLVRKDFDNFVKKCLNLPKYNQNDKNKAKKEN